MRHRGVHYTCCLAAVARATPTPLLKSTPPSSPARHRHAHRRVAAAAEPPLPGAIAAAASSKCYAARRRVAGPRPTPWPRAPLSSERARRCRCCSSSVAFTSPLPRDIPAAGAAPSLLSVSLLLSSAVALALLWDVVRSLSLEPHRPRLELRRASPRMLLPSMSTSSSTSSLSLSLIPLARARQRLGRFLWHDQGRALADSFGTSKVAPWHEQGRALAGSFSTSKITPWQIPLAQARSRLGTSKAVAWNEQGCALARARHTLARFWERLNIYYKEGLSSLGAAWAWKQGRPSSMPWATMPRQNPWTNGPSHPFENVPSTLSMCLLTKQIVAVVEPGGRKGTRR
ncbi:hypothetical protein Scep_004016 [Stephania cephalantha]|uniref:Uncharacterized protein n=1 Tax=Stephania cephalantha TaxID=152367 RepID=A0AAP0KTH8_9MAGN